MNNSLGIEFITLAVGLVFLFVSGIFVFSSKDWKYNWLRWLLFGIFFLAAVGLLFLAISYSVDPSNSSPVM